jgi:hypothetical protein
VIVAVAWGNVAEWAATLGTFAAFGATVLLRHEVDARRRDVAERERPQASLVSCWLEDDGSMSGVVTCVATTSTCSSQGRSMALSPSMMMWPRCARAGNSSRLARVREGSNGSARPFRRAPSSTSGGGR